MIAMRIKLSNVASISSIFRGYVAGRTPSGPNSIYGAHPAEQPNPGGIQSNWRYQIVIIARFNHNLVNFLQKLAKTINIA
jgi:hypothetical protein